MTPDAIGAAPRNPAPALATLVPPLWVVVVLSATVHLAMAALIPLFQDEAYYALWATHPALGYYDHPPMIAWWIWLGEALFGATPFGVRILSVLAFTAVTPLCWRMATLVGGCERAGRIAALYFNVMVLPFALGFAATPDAPSTLFWALATWGVVEALHAFGGRPRAGWWFLAGAAAGLGVLSKFTGLFYCFGLVGWLLATSPGRASLRRPVVWLTAGLGLLMVAPNVLWNYQHDWLGLQRQFGRLAVAGPHRAWVGSYLLAMIAAITPGILGALAVGVVTAGRKASLLLWTMAPLALYMLAHSTHSQVQANWLAPLFPGFAVLAAIGSDRRPATFVALNAGLGLGLSVLAVGLAFWPGAPFFRGDNPPNQTKGWPAFANDLHDLAVENGAVWVATAGYGLTGSLAFYLPGRPVWDTTDQVRYGFRGAFPRDYCTAPGLFVVSEADAAEANLHFSKVGAVKVLVRRSLAAEVMRYAVIPVSGVTDPALCAQPQTQGANRLK